MTQELLTPSIKPPKPATKNRFFRFAWVFVIVLVLGVPYWSLRNYSNILLSTPQAPATARADCAVVLTGGAGRVREGIALLSHKQVKKLIISGVHQHSTLTDMFPEILFYPEIDLEDVVLERRSSSTAGNAQQSLILIDALHCQSILLVTSDYHMYRSLKTFKLALPSTIEITAYPVPSERLHRRLWSAALEEWWKYLFYSMFVF